MAVKIQQERQDTQEQDIQERQEINQLKIKEVVQIKKK